MDYECILTLLQEIYNNEPITNKQRIALSYAYEAVKTLEDMMEGSKDYDKGRISRNTTNT